MIMTHTHVWYVAVSISQQLRKNTPIHPQNLQNAMNDITPNHNYNIEHLQMLSLQLKDIAKDYQLLYNQLQAYRQENTDLKQQIQKLQMLTE